LTKFNAAVVAILLVFFVLALVFYPRMPDIMASHWNVQGEADGYMSRFWALFLMPFVSTGIALLMVFIPRIDPLKANVAKFKAYYFGFVVMFLLFMLYIYVLTILWNLDVRFDFSQLLIPALGILLYAVGVMTGKAKRNYFIGIRTPWTLASEEVWDRTHKLGGVLFKIASIITILTVIIPDYAIWVMLVVILTTTFVTVIYSYVVYGKLEHMSR
jgi:uncharacterized membrane protein